MKVHFQKHKKAFCAIIAVVVAIVVYISLYTAVLPSIAVVGGSCIGAVTFITLHSIAQGQFGSLVVRSNLERIGLVNRKGEPPFLLRHYPDPTYARGMIYEFTNRGIPYEDWLDIREKLEAAFNIFVYKIAPGKSRRRVLVYAVPADEGIPKRLEWSPIYLINDDFSLSLGRGLQGIVTIDLAVVPHILIGGSTGSGKSVLLKNLLMQCVFKGCEIYIADFKGGLDYPSIWWEKTQVVTEPVDFLQKLQKIEQEMRHRIAVLRKADKRNIKDFNLTHSEYRYPRIIIACDEAAQLLDKTGRSKEEKEVIEQVTKYLALFARQGRAVGVHLMLATQRPDANVIPGSIKSELDCRICGRADLVLSQIVIDSGAAHDQIPKDAQGRFLLGDGGDGTLFQGFWFDDSNWWYPEGMAPEVCHVPNVKK